MTLYFNSGTQPLVPEGKWGGGVIMPGEPYETDAALGPPWTTDPEAEAAFLARRAASAGVGSDSATEAVSGAAQALSEAPSEPPVAEPPVTHMLAGAVTDPPASDPPLHVESNGDVVTDSGAVVGHVEIDPAPQGGQPGGTA